MIPALQNTQHILDEAKEQISEKIYLDLSDSLKKVFDIKPQNMYRVTFLFNQYKKIQVDYYADKFKTINTIVELCHDEYEVASSTIKEKNVYVCKDTCLHSKLLDSMPGTYINYNTSSEYSDDDMYETILIRPSLIITKIIQI